jgi:hypothetical protein
MTLIESMVFSPKIAYWGKERRGPLAGVDVEERRKAKFVTALVEACPVMRHLLNSVLLLADSIVVL